MRTRGISDAGMKRLARSVKAQDMDEINADFDKARDLVIEAANILNKYANKDFATDRPVADLIENLDDIALEIVDFYEYKQPFEKENPELFRKMQEEFEK